MKLNKKYRSRVVMTILATSQKIHKVSKCTKTCNKNQFPSYLYPFQWSIRSWFMNALIKLVTRAPSTRKRDLIAPTVSKMTPKMTSKVTPKMTSGTPSGALWSNPSPEGLGKGSGGPNAYKTTEKPPQITTCDSEATWGFINKPKTNSGTLSRQQMCPNECA